MSDKKYLYYNNRWHGLQRDEIVRETPAFYFVGNNGHQKVSKKGLYVRCGSWDSIQYYEETPELKDQYEKQEAYKKMIAEFHARLDQLRKIDDPEIIKKVMEIDIEQTER